MSKTIRHPPFYRIPPFCKPPNFMENLARKNLFFANSWRLHPPLHKRAVSTVSSISIPSGKIKPLAFLCLHRL